MKTSQISKEGILALKEEYEKRLEHVKQQIKKYEKSKFLIGYNRELFGKKIELDRMIKDLEELLK